MKFSLALFPVIATCQSVEDDALLQAKSISVTSDSMNSSMRIFPCYGDRSRYATEHGDCEYYGRRGNRRGCFRHSAPNGVMPKFVCRECRLCFDCEEGGHQCPKGTECRGGSCVPLATDTICSNTGIYQGTFTEEEESPEPVPDYDLSALTDDVIKEIIAELRMTFTSEHSCWPSDNGHYGPFFVRLSWHAAGSYRSTDGAGGSIGGRQRFFPESEWLDNANLLQARGLLAPIKLSHPEISWGDLFQLAGTVAIVDMGGPTDDFCFGRQDDNNGDASDQLNCDPAALAAGLTEASQGAPCAQFDAELFGQDGQGLIYINAQGPNGVPNPYLSAQDVLRTFSRMGMTNANTVALVGGGHAFGQTHALAGPNMDTPTSGFEGAWTNRPTTWTNDYFRALIDYDWEQVSTRDFVVNRLGKEFTSTNDGSNIQWQTVDPDSEFARTIMLTGDLALKAHTDFSPTALEYKKSLARLSTEFAAAWTLLMENGNGFVDHRKCIRISDFFEDDEDED